MGGREGLAAMASITNFLTSAMGIINNEIGMVEERLGVTHRTATQPNAEAVSPLSSGPRGFASKD